MRAVSSRRWDLHVRGRVPPKVLPAVSAEGTWGVRILIVDVRNFLVAGWKW